MMSKILVAALLSATAMATVAASAAELSDGVVKIGVLNDQSGTYSDFGGKGSVVAAQMAIDEFNGPARGIKVELVSADHQSKADIAASTARRWYEVEKVDAIADLTSSSVAIAVNAMARDMNKITLMTGPGTTILTNKECSPTGFHWGWDTYSQSVTSAKALLDQGFKDWYIIAADYAFGHQMQADLTKAVTEGGGRVVGAVRHPLSTMDFSSYLLQAQASGAKLIALANGGADTVNTLKQAADFGIVAGGQSTVAMVIVLSDIHALGLETAKGLTFTTPFYWDRNDESRDFSQRYYEKMGSMPGMVHAATYSSVLHYLKAVEAAGTDEAKAVAAKMRETPVRDSYTQTGKIRPDGRMITDMYLVQVKDPSQSKRDWDYQTILSTIPAEQTAQPLEMSECVLVEK